MENNAIIAFVIVEAVMLLLRTEDWDMSSVDRYNDLKKYRQTKNVTICDQHAQMESCTLDKNATLFGCVEPEIQAMKRRPASTFHE